MGSINHSLAVKPDTAYLRKIIESSLLADWAIKIEYLADESEAVCWQMWDKTHFAIRSAQPVIEALLDCYTKNPKSIIRLSAEKFRPQSRLLFTVYNPTYLPEDTISRPETYAKPSKQEHSWTAPSSPKII